MEHNNERRKARMRVIDPERRQQTSGEVTSSEAEAAGERIIRSISDFLSFSDAASLVSVNSRTLSSASVVEDIGGLADGLESSTVDDWAVGTSMERPRWSSSDHVDGNLNSSRTNLSVSRHSIASLATPPTPALVAVSPNPDYDFEDDVPADEGVRLDSRRAWAQEKLAAAVFSHPQPLRSFCLDAYQAAKAVEVNQSHCDKRHPLFLSSGLLGDMDSSTAPETWVEPQRGRHIPGGDEWIRMITSVLSQVFDNIPLSVVLDLLGGCREVTLDSSFATVRITAMTVNGIVNAIIHVFVQIWEEITHLDPLGFAHMIITRPFNMMAGTTEVVVSGIQSVATGMGSASSMALHRLSTNYPSTSSLMGSQGNQRNFRSPQSKAMSKKLLRKLSSLNSAASVISYTELDDNNGGLSRHAKSRVQRMMHYDVSLRPFVATVKLEETFKRGMPTVTDESDSNLADGSSSSSPLESPFMCTPQSFPPTPASRRMVLARGTRHADNVVFLARSQLRVHDGLGSSNERTREMAEALKEGKRLAVFDADDASAGIDLTCGQHVATKVGNSLYCSIRSMIPILRNCFVYFEMTVLPRPGGSLLAQTSMATLSLGLSTKEMPPNTLVGAWRGSVGMCTPTAQILINSEWCNGAGVNPNPNPITTSYGDRQTVGCLVILDDSTAFETWDCMMVNVHVAFNINGLLISPPVPSLPVSGSDQHQSTLPAISGGAFPPWFTLTMNQYEELYPTLTLHSPGTSVMCRFSAEDIVAPSRDSIGAPKKVPIYAVDGSLIFKEE